MRSVIGVVFGKKLPQFLEILLFITEMNESVMVIQLTPFTRDYNYGVVYVIPFKIHQNKNENGLVAEKFQNLLCPGKRKNVNIQRLSPRFRSQQFFFSKICGEMFHPNS